MQTPGSELILSRLHELCPEIKELNICPVVLHKGSRY